MMNRPNSLEKLRELGYKTFHPYIDETYDTIENDQERMVAIVDEVERLNKLTDSEWLEWQNGIKDIVEHNHNLLKTVDATPLNNIKIGTNNERT